MAESGLNATAAAVLGLLHEAPMTGGQIVAEAGRRLGPFWTTTRSQVYRELPALADRKLVRAGKQGARAAQPYAITAAGKKAFTRWLDEPAGFDQMRNPLMLRSAFGEQQSAGQRRELYIAKRAEHTDAVEDLKEQIKQSKKDGDKYATATLEFALNYHKSLLKWLDTAPGK